MTKRQVFILIGFVIILIAIPVSLYLVRQTQIFAPKAAFIPKLEFVDASGNVITKTTSRVVLLKATKEVLQPPSPSPSPISTPGVSPSPSPSPSPAISPTPSPSPSPAISPIPSPSPSPSVTPSPSASPSPSSVEPSPQPSPSPSPIVSPSPAGILPFRVSFDPNFATIALNGDMGTETSLTLDLALTGGPGLKSIYVQFFENGVWGPTPPQTASILLK